MNLLQYTEEFDNANWIIGNASVVANSAVAPNSRVTADKLVEDNSSFGHSAFQIPNGNVLTSTTYTLSVYAKTGGRNWIFVEFITYNLPKFGWFDLVNGVTGTVSSSTTSAISNEGNGWYRCSIATSSQFGGNSPLHIVGLANADNVTTYAGDGASGAYVWGAQFELGALGTYDPKPPYYFPVDTLIFGGAL